MSTIVYCNKDSRLYCKKSRLDKYKSTLTIAEKRRFPRTSSLLSFFCCNFSAFVAPFL